MSPNDLSSSFLDFDDPAVEELFHELKRLDNGTPCLQSLVTFIQSVDDLPDGGDFTEKDTATSHHSQGSKESRDTNRNSMSLMPQIHGDGSFPGNRHRLAVWLFLKALLFCPITRMIPVVKSLVRFTHLLLPQNEGNNREQLQLYEYVMGMAPGTFSVHSRLFLIPLSVHVRHLFDGHLLLFLPDVAQLRDMTLYLFQRIVESLKVDAGRMTLEQKMENVGDEAGESPWLRLCSTEGSQFRAGAMNDFYLVQHPDTHRSLRLQTSSKFRSHVSPFAAALNAIITLGEWQEGAVTPTMAQCPEDLLRSEATSTDSSLCKSELRRGLELSGFDGEKVEEMTNALHRFHRAVTTLERYWYEDKEVTNTRTPSSRREDRDSSKGGRGGSGGKGGGSGGQGGGSGGKGGGGIGGDDVFGGQGRLGFPAIIGQFASGTQRRPSIPHHRQFYRAITTLEGYWYEDKEATNTRTSSGRREDQDGGKGGDVKGGGSSGGDDVSGGRGRLGFPEISRQFATQNQARFSGSTWRSEVSDSRRSSSSSPSFDSNWQAQSEDGVLAPEPHAESRVVAASPSDAQRIAGQYRDCGESSSTDRDKPSTRSSPVTLVQPSHPPDESSDTGGTGKKHVDMLAQFPTDQSSLEPSKTDTKVHSRSKDMVAEDKAPTRSSSSAKEVRIREMQMTGSKEGPTNEGSRGTGGNKKKKRFTSTGWRALLPSLR
ncbi:hypothetical protein AAF712_003547 [Marasmius tenuissimus]|uniref:Uncharacterized protein n=1 Tax=Marasmius tenuissimus TaxID=585030 RepID=A0ABR3A6B5_9AGAR